MAEEYTATYLENVSEYFAGAAGLWRMSPPLRYERYEATGEDVNDFVGHEAQYVIVSAANVMFSGPETYIFPATASGEIVTWGELPGSYKGGLSQQQALRNAGYTPVGEGLPR